MCGKIMNWESINEPQLPFPDRESAAILLGDKIKNKLKDTVLVLAIPRGGVVTGKVIAKILNSKLDLIVCKKVGHPGNPEYAIGSVCADGSSIQTDSGSEQLKDYFNRESVKLTSWLTERYAQLTGRSKPESVSGKNILLCDDGVATGSTVRAAVKSLKKNKANRIYVATPVISQTALNQLRKDCDQIFYLNAPHPFGAVGEFYASFPTINDYEVQKQMKT